MTITARSGVLALCLLGIAACNTATTAPVPTVPVAPAPAPTPPRVPAAPPVRAALSLLSPSELTAFAGLQDRRNAVRAFRYDDTTPRDVPVTGSADFASYFYIFVPRAVSELQVEGIATTTMDFQSGAFQVASTGPVFGNRADPDDHIVVMPGSVTVTDGHIGTADNPRALSGTVNVDLMLDDAALTLNGPVEGSLSPNLSALSLGNDPEADYPRIDIVTGQFNGTRAAGSVVIIGAPDS